LFKGGREAGVTIIYFLAWVGLVLKLEYANICQENVPSFLTQLLQTYLGHLYFIDYAIETPKPFGHPVSRDRKLTCLRHKLKTVAWMSPLAPFFKRFHRVCNTTWRDFFCSTEAEQAEDHDC